MIERLENNKDGKLYEKLKKSSRFGMTETGPEVQKSINIGIVSNFLKVLMSKTKEKEENSIPKKNKRTNFFHMQEKLSQNTLNKTIETETPSLSIQDHSQNEKKKKLIKNKFSNVIKLRKERRIKDLKEKFLILPNTMIPRISNFKLDFLILESENGIKR